jgi:hypothetical protein
VVAEPPDLRGLDRVHEPGRIQISLGNDEDLGIVLQTAEVLAMDNAILVALERRARGLVRFVLETDRGGRQMPGSRPQLIPYYPAATFKLLTGDRRLRHSRLLQLVGADCRRPG